MSYSIGKTALKTFDIERAVYGKFDGSTNYVSVPDNVNLNFGTGDFSIEIFFELVSIKGEQVLLSKWASGEGAYIIKHVSSNVFTFLLDDNIGHTTGYIVASSVNTPILINTKYHVVFIVNRTTSVISTYINGIFNYSFSCSSITGNVTNVGSLCISSFPIIGMVYNGNEKFYLTRLHNRALSASEVLAYYNNGRPDLYVIPYSDRWGSQTNLNTQALPLTSSLSGAWATVSATLSVDKIYSLNTIYTGGSINAKYSTTGTSVLAVINSGTSYTFTCTEARQLVIYKDNTTETTLSALTLTEVGVVADYRFNEGAGYQVKDYSNNKLHGTLNGIYDNFWQNNKQYFTTEFTFLHSAISSTAATTTLFKLPANVKIKEIIVDPTVAFDTDNTISLGISGNETWLATLTGTNATTPQYANVDKMYSPNNEVQLYIKKAGASSAGSITLKFRFENMNWKGCLPCPSIL